jgi:hypothetical protein
MYSYTFEMEPHSRRTCELFLRSRKDNNLLYSVQCTRVTELVRSEPEPEFLNILKWRLSWKCDGKASK